jgi:KaiC/GvpD/RAD55 family RecA-like ATPase
MTDVLQFGIPSFDALFGHRRDRLRKQTKYEYGAYGVHLPNSSCSTSISIIGPDGTGKSVFGLHLASQYIADAVALKRRPETICHLPRVLYVSTDLKHHVAEVMWRNFGLDKPNQRDFPFYWAARQGHVNSNREVALAQLDPEKLKAAVLDDCIDPEKVSVQFVDLVSKTTGDDWGFINRLLAVLENPPAKSSPHLLVIDAVEGFETLVGEKDAFGETTSRRARIAQVMRTAGKKCHVCFIVEEPKTDERFPEEFVTDVVVRLRNVTVNNYARRTVEILKARGQSHVRGQHAFVIRESRPKIPASKEVNADEPEVKNSYVHIYPSLHYLSREEMKSGGSSQAQPRARRVAAFGITYLDEMLARVDEDPANGLDDQGLPAQTTTALIGEVATQKTSLATAFLARTFRVFTFRLAELVREIHGRGGARQLRKALAIRLAFEESINGKRPKAGLTQKINKLVKAIEAWNSTRLQVLMSQFGPKSGVSHHLDTATSRVRFAAWLAEALPDNGAVVLLTTSDQDRARLVVELDRWLQNSRDKAFRDWPGSELPPAKLHKGYAKPFHDAVLEHLTARTICRRLELHDLSSTILFQIIQRSVERAQQKVFLSDDLQPDVDRLPYSRAARFSKSWNIRVVLDDLSSLKDAYPEIGSDPIFLPFLLSYLELEGVTSLIVDSQQGRPNAQVTDALDRELRALVPHKILTWRVPFFGSIRDAITLVPPYPSGLPSLVREVRWQAREQSSNALVVDPELELYDGLQTGEVKPIPLEVRLYSETSPTSEYIREQNEILGQLFNSCNMSCSDTASEPKIIIGVEPSPRQYDSFRDFCNLQTHTLLNHTLLFQVDEFWATSRTVPRSVSQFPRGPVSRREGSLYPLGHYLVEDTSARAQNGKLIPDLVVDPFGVFQGHPIVREGQVDPDGPWQRRHYFTRSSQGRPRDLHSSDLANIDRVPYTWDFGFLLCPSSMWESVGQRKIGYKNLTVSHVWQRMPNVVDREQKPYVSWRSFLGACKTVAQAQAEKASQLVRPIDVSTLSGESLCCLMLEIWASEIVDTLPKEKLDAFVKSVAHVEWKAQTDQSLTNWLNLPEYLLAFYRTWLLLIDVMVLSDVVDRQAIPRIKMREADGSAAATRHWYKTACGHQLCPLTNEFALTVRLPGHFSVRGDWFLAVAGGSRSERLAYRALDLFSTRRANFRRMELGIGLPTRDIAPEDEFDRLPTALVKVDMLRQKTAVTYGELIGTGIQRRPHFSWLWRSQLRDYHRHSIVFQRWIAQLIAKWEDLRSTFGPGWQSGFEIFDSLEGKTQSSGHTILNQLESWSMFEDMCGLLRKQLEIASLSAPRAQAEMAGE